MYKMMAVDAVEAGAVDVCPVSRIRSTMILFSTAHGQRRDDWTDPYRRRRQLERFTRSRQQDGPADFLGHGPVSYTHLDVYKRQFAACAVPCPRALVQLAVPGLSLIHIYAGRIRHHLDQIEKDTFGLVSRTGMGRSIHIAVVPTLATTWLIPRLADFQREQPDITVSLSVRTLPSVSYTHLPTCSAPARR